jgi:hypothetical protein
MLEGEMIAKTESAVTAQRALMKSGSFGHIALYRHAAEQPIRANALLRDAASRSKASRGLFDA